MSKKKFLYEQIMKSLSWIVTANLLESMTDVPAGEGNGTVVTVIDTDKNISRKLMFSSKYNFMKFMYIAALKAAVNRYFDGLEVKFISNADAVAYKKFADEANKMKYSTEVHMNSLIEMMRNDLKPADNIDDFVKILCDKTFNEKGSLSKITSVKPVK